MLTSRSRVSAHIYDGIVLLHRGQYVKSTESPFSTFASENRGDSYVAVYRDASFVDELECALYYISGAYLARDLTHTAIVKRPHFDVSGLSDFRRTCQPRGVTLSVAM